MAVEKISYPDGIYNQLRDEILSGKLRPGHRLAEVEVAQRMGTSQGPVREAFMRLREQGLLISFRHKGTYVSEISEDEARHAYAVRGMIEPYAIQIALPRMSEEHFALLEEQIHAMEQAAQVNDIAADLASDMRFHRYLYEWSNSATLLQCWDVIELKIRKFAIVASPPVFKDLLLPVRSHYPLLARMREGWSKALADELERHLKVIWATDAEVTKLTNSSRRRRPSKRATKSRLG